MLATQFRCEITINMTFSTQELCVENVNLIKIYVITTHVSKH